MNDLSSCLWIPEERFTAKLKADLTVSIYKLDNTTAKVEAFRTDRAGFIGIPRVFGLKSISLGPHTDSRTNGFPVTFPKQLKLRDYQIPFVASMLSATQTHSDFVAEAPTGKGKTVCGLAVIQKLGRSAVVIVDQENLLDQWIARCIEHLGMREEDIGVVQGNKATYGKAITICMMQTLTRRSLPEEFYSSAGVVIWDECHTAGAPTFSRSLMLFPAKVRFGLSATPERRDGLQKILAWNLGTTDVRMTQEHETSLVYVLESDGTYSWRVNNSKMVGGFINEVAADGLRNLTIARAVKWLYNSGRDVLVIGDRIAHLCALQALVHTLGVPEEATGIYAKSKTVLRYEKDPRPPRRPYGWEKGTEYTPIRLSFLTKTIRKDELEKVKAQARVIFASYGIMAKGVDIPRLSAGVDATPRSTSTQVHGRILRTLPGKLRPIWVTIADTNSFRSLYQITQRLPEYQSSNAEVFLWNIQKGRKVLDVHAYRADLSERIAVLRQTQTVTSLDGNNTLLIPNKPIGKEKRRGKTTGRQTPYR